MSALLAQPYLTTLPLLARLWLPDGTSHVVDGLDGTLLCGVDRPQGAAADPSQRGELAYDLATCPACKLVAERVVAGAGIERLAAGLQAASSDVPLDPAAGKKQVLAEETARMERLSYRLLWSALLLGLLLAATGQFTAGALLALGGAVARGIWTLLRRGLHS